jgi:trimethylamine:corrinoid methyltransferase-like protein
MVTDNHLAHELEAIVKPIQVDEAHLQADLIEQVGIGGHFLKLSETRDFTRREYIPLWPPADKTISEIVREQALEIYYDHEPPPLPEEAAQKLENIIAEADTTLQ